MASEDSEELVPGFTVIHRLRDLDDLGETVVGHMAILDHQVHAVRELLKVGLLRCAEWMPAEERNDHFHQIRSLWNDELTQVLFVVVMTPVDIDPANAKELFEFPEAGKTLRSLSHGKPW
jgi:hypothetical protein